MNPLFGGKRQRIATIDEALGVMAKAILSQETRDGIEDALKSAVVHPTVTITMKVRHDAKSPGLIAASIETAVSTELGGISLYGLEP
jgi:hypothetical protein